MLDRTPGALVVDRGGSQPAVLEVAAAPLDENDTSPRTHRCSIQVRPPGGAPAREKHFEVSGHGHWSEVRIEIEAAAAGTEIALACDDPEAVVWAQPVLLPAAPPAPEPLIVALCLDTLRADHVTGFAEPEVPTPQLERVFREGLPFTAAASPYTWTLPSHFSLFYSRMYGFPPRTEPVPGLVELLANAGFATAGFTGGGFVGAAFRFHYGFDRYGEYDASKVGRSDIDMFPEAIADAERWIDDHDSVPSFVFLHTYAVHELPKAEHEKQLQRAVPLPTDLTAEEVAVARDFYAELVGRVDAQLAGFFDKLRALAERRPTMLVVLSDHGEGFREHKHNFRHGIGGPTVSLHDEVIHIPIIFWAPGIVAPSDPATYPFSLLDVAPTLLAGVGLPVPASMVGRDFWPLLAGGWNRHFARLRSGWDAPAVSYKNADWGLAGAWSSRTASRKNIVMEGLPPESSLVESYDLAGDPFEKTNLAAAKPLETAAEAISGLQDDLRRLEVEIPKEMRSLPACAHCSWAEISTFLDMVDPRLRDTEGKDGKAARPVDDETRERLRALGYLN